jgi:hypothetical protein
MKDDGILDNEEKELGPIKIGALLQIAIMLIFAGALIGASTNLVNGLASPLYFKNIMGWNFSGIWKAAISQGIFEGALYGVIFSLIYTILFAFITKVRGDWNFAKSIIIKAVRLIYVCWVIGGIAAILFAFVFWEGYDQAIIKVPQEIGSRIGYAWVGGSIIGGMVGGIIAVPYSLIITTRNWFKK